jgi:cation transport ATPase
VAKMERLVEDAQNSASRTQRLIDSCAKHYTPGTPARSPPGTTAVSKMH